MISSSGRATVPRRARPGWRLPSPPGSWLSFSARAGDRLVLFIQQNTYDFLTDIWSTDGTAGSTHKLASLKLGSTPAVTSGESLLYFSALNPGDPWNQADELWVTDGTSSGTRMLTHFTPEDSLGACSTQPRIVGDELLFCASTWSTGTQIWISDGTPAGTFPLSAFGDIYPFAYYAYRVEATKLADSYYFLGYGEDNAYSLWRSEGTPGAAVRVRRIASAVDTLAGSPWLERVGNRLVFWGYDDGWRPFGSDGTAAGTAPLAETSTGTCPPFSGSAEVVGDRLLFVALDDEQHHRLWSTGGTEPSTFPLSDGIQDIEDGSERGLLGAAIGGDWLFPARDAATGFEPWAADPAHPHSAYRVAISSSTSRNPPGTRVRGAELAFSPRRTFIRRLRGLPDRQHRRRHLRSPASVFAVAVSAASPDPPPHVRCAPASSSTIRRTASRPPCAPGIAAPARFTAFSAARAANAPASLSSIPWEMQRWSFSTTTDRARRSGAPTARTQALSSRSPQRRTSASIPFPISERASCS
jgi:ELWxxDGT repeat protein